MSAGRPREAAVVTKWMCEESTTVLLEDKRVLEIFQITNTFWTRVEGHKKFDHLDFTSAGPESAFLRIVNS